VDDEELLAALRVEAANFAACVASSDLATEVPTCPEWTIGDLARHTGGVHRWATLIVETGDAGHDFSSDGPDAPADLAAWLIAGAEQLHRVLAETDPERRCWTFGFPPERVGFWRRRQALETAVHRWDATHAVGEVTGIAPQLASAAVDEVVDFLYPRQVALGRTAELAVRVELVSTDLDVTWLLGPTGTEPRIQISGPAASLALLLWRRVAFDDPSITIVGTDADVAAMREARLAP